MGKGELEQVYGYVDANLGRYVGLLERLCAQPSVSAEGVGLGEMAELTARVMGELGIPARTIPTAGAPMVYGELAGRSSRTVLLYNHYDVQPVDPIASWESPPFEPTIRDGRLYARGAYDDKSDLLARLAAVEALLTVEGELPVSLKYIVEGEEEMDGVTVYDFVRANGELLAADVCFLEALDLAGDGRPQVCAGSKGFLYVDLEAGGLAVDGHSMYGPVVPNPAWELIGALATLRDRAGRVLIPGFYDDVVPLTDADRAVLGALPGDDEAALRAQLGLESFLGGVSGAAFNERLYGEASTSLCGLHTGYGGPGLKTIIPASAVAKVDFRLVPNQRPADILAKLRRHLDEQGYGGVAVRPIGSSQQAGVRVPIDAPIVGEVTGIFREFYGVEPLLTTVHPGGCVMEPFISAAGAATLFAGTRPAGGNVHAPNEYIELATLAPAIKWHAYLLSRLGEAG